MLKMKGSLILKRKQDVLYTLVDIHKRRYLHATPSYYPLLAPQVSELYWRRAVVMPTALLT